MRQKTFRTKLGLLAITAGALLFGMFFVFIFKAWAFVGPPQSPPSGYGAIGTDASNNVAVGTSTTISGTKLLVVGSTSNNTTYALQVLENNKTPIFILRDDGSVAIETSTLSAGNTVIGGNLTVGGVLTASFLSGSVNASNVSSGEFGWNTNGGNFEFPGWVYVGASSTAGDYNTGLFLEDTGNGTSGAGYLALETPDYDYGGAGFTQPGDLFLNSFQSLVIDAGVNNAGIYIASSTNNISIGQWEGPPVAPLQVVTAIPGYGGYGSFAHTFVVGASGTVGGVGIGYDTTNNQGYIESASPGTAWRKLVIQSNGVGFWNNSGESTSSEIMTLTNGGNVGIHVTSPEDALTVASSGVIGWDNGSGSNGVVLSWGGNASLNVGTAYGNANGTLNVAGLSSNYVGEGNQGFYLLANKEVDYSGVGGPVQFDISSSTNDYNGANASVVLNSSGTSYLNGGNVGIGTTSPAYRLTVNGTTSALAYCINGANCITAWPSGGTSQWTTSSTAIYYNGGNVGIGTANPTNLFQVAGTAQLQQVWLRNSDYVTGSTGSTILFGAAAGSGNTYYEFQPYTAGGTVYGNLVLNPLGGNVGIGTTTPATALSVNGTVTATGFAGPLTGAVTAANVSSGQFGSNTGGGGYSFSGTLGVGGQLSASVGSAGAPSYSFTGALTSGLYETDANGFSMAATGVKVASFYSGSVRWMGANYFSSSSVASWTPGNAEAGGVDVGLSRYASGVMAVGTGGQGSYAGTLIAGNVGIGQASPGTPLYVEKDGSGVQSLVTLKNNSTAASVQGEQLALSGYYGNALITASYNPNTGYGGVLQLQTYNGSNVLNTGMTMDQNGNVGIGNSTPNANLQVNGAATAYSLADGIFELNAGITNQLSMGALNSGSYGWWLQAVSNNLITTYPILLNPAGGNVGIGTTTPGYPLSVNGQVNATGYCINGANCISAWPAGGSGTVTSVVAGTGLSGGTITTAGTIAVNYGSSANQAAMGNVTITGPSAGSGLSGGGGSISVGAGGTFSAISLNLGNTNTWTVQQNFNGNVGIGTTTAPYLLTVNGTTTAKSYCINGANCINAWPSGGGGQWTTSGTAIYYSGGNVGIGTQAPSSTFAVGGIGISGAGVYGAGTAYGVYGNGTGGAAYGVYGTGNTSGVYGSGNSYGVYGSGTGDGGYFTGQTGVYGSGGGGGASGVYGINLSGYGVYGNGSTGVYASGTAYGVDAVATSASTAYGVYATASGNSNDEGVYGNGSLYGVYGTVPSPNTSTAAIYGYDGYASVEGYNVTGPYGGYFLSASNIGLYAQGSQGGVHAVAAGTGSGVYATCSSYTSCADFIGGGGETTSGGNWVNGSAVYLKEYFTPVNDQTILNKILQLPITKWVYKSDDTAWHIGPVAEDFYSIFGLGDNSSSISTIDPASIALVGVKALDEQINTQQQEINALQAQNATLSSEVQQLMNR